MQPQKKPRQWNVAGLSSLLCATVLWKADSAGGASVSASATLGALVGVDAIDVALRDSANGAFVDAGATSNAVGTNYISHSESC